MDRLERFGSAGRVIQIGFWVNAGLMTMKLLAGHFGRSEAVFADGMESAADLIAILASMIALRIGSQPYDEAHPYGHGKAESLAAIIQEEAFESLDAPVRILGALDTPVPYSPPLEEYFLPSDADVERAARLLMAY